MQACIHTVTHSFFMYVFFIFILTYMCAQNCGNERKVRNAQTAECTSVSLNKSIILDMNLLTKRIFDHIYRCHVKKLIAEAQSVPLLLLT